MAKKKTILVTCDADPVLEFGRKVFLRQGCEVLTAATGTEVLDLCKSQRPDLAVIDLGITDPGGLTVLRTLQGDAATTEMPVVVVADKSQADSVISFMGKGMMDYLAKPVRLVELTRRTAELLSIPFRCPLRVPVTVARSADPGAAPAACEIYDISINGVRVVGEIACAIGAGLRLAFRLPGRDTDTEVAGLVMRTAPLGTDKEYGVEFLDTPDEVLDLIQEYTTEGAGA